ncbi:MAG TPA: transglycosylase SLT domain-containing protein [Syntrophobacteraceae bacterium]|nr:transglycosylase SLT domain-containing protein [Syntrophobacteraceae bacterium]
MKGRRQTERLGAAAAAVVLILGVCGCASLQTTDTGQQPAAVQAVESHKAPASASVDFASVKVPYIPPPNSIDLCGEPVPLERQDVYERFDKEFTLVVYNHAQVYLWLKRMERYFPIIEERLHYYNLPDDLKYVAIVESDLLPNACSPKGAAGPWQFMPGTGAAYGLDRRGSVDKRYDFERSTESAFLLLNDLYNKYHSWSLAIAAYNCGDRRILDESRIQGVRDYYDLKLPQETERYVFRILAVKAVLSNPNQYGYDLPKGWGYQELRLDRVTVSLSRPVPIQTIANAAGTTYREIKRLNPIFRSDDIPAGNHEINLPVGAAKMLEQNFRAGNEVTVGTVSPENYTAQGQELPAPGAPAATPSSSSSASRIAVAIPSAKAGSPRAKQEARQKIYLVKKGDSLSAIAHRYQISTQELKSANKLKSSDLKQGQKLRIP